MLADDTWTLMLDLSPKTPELQFLFEPLKHDSGYSHKFVAVFTGCSIGFALTSFPISKYELSSREEIFDRFRGKLAKPFKATSNITEEEARRLNEEWPGEVAVKSAGMIRIGIARYHEKRPDLETLPQEEEMELLLSKFILEELLDRSPTWDELKVGSALGRAITDTFGSWWYHKPRNP